MYSKGSHTMRLIIGIISIVLCLIILIQSCAAGIGNAIADNGEAGGTGGLILSIFMLISGIIAIAARKSKGGTNNINCILRSRCCYSFCKCRKL